MSANQRIAISNGEGFDTQPEFPEIKRFHDFPFIRPNRLCRCGHLEHLHHEGSFCILRFCPCHRFRQGR